MDSVALYRKYRPNNFENLVGQDHVRTTLMNALKQEHVSHAYLFSGPRGTGKTSTARLLAKALNCQNLKDGYEPCDKCEFCHDILEGKFIDLIEIDAASNRGIDEVRDLNEKIRFAPSRGNYKIYIIDEVHMMTKEAFNALLKTLEEPPSHAYFILATTEIHKIPETIISRCQRFDFKRITEKEIRNRLAYIADKENVQAEEKALAAISRYVDGGMRDAIGLFEQMTVDGKLKFDHIQDVLGISNYDLLDDLYKALVEQNSADALKLIHKLHDQGSDLKQFIYEFIDSLRNKMLESVKKGDQNGVTRLMRIIEVFQEAERELHSASIPQLPVEIAVIKVAGGLSEKIEEMPAMVEKPKAKSVVEKAKKVIEKVKESREHKAVEKKDTEEKPSVESEFGALDLKTLQDNWPRVTERVKTPSLRMSLISCKPVELKGSEVTLQFNTNFHKANTMKHDHRIILEDLIKNLFNEPVKISAIVKEIEIKSVVEEEPQVVEEKEEPQSGDNLDQALKIFGGEVVE